MAENALNSQPANSSRKSTIDALEAITKLQEALTEKAQKLEADLKEIDRLIEASTVEEVEDDPESEIAIPGSKRAVGLFPSSEFLNPLSPFYEEASRRTKYLLNTHPRPMKGKESEVLADAVKKENERLEAIRRSHISDADIGTPIDLLNNIEGLDWERIAERVSDSSSVKRTAKDCRVIWIGNQHPRINHSEWSPLEIDKLYALVSVYQQQRATIDWVEVAAKLGTNRIPIDCMRHALPRQRLVWTPEVDQRLITAVETYGNDNWQLVARKVSEHATATQCHARWQKTLDPTVKHGTWTEQEDNQLRKAVAGYGMSWVQVAAAVPGRTNDQCRERWLEHLNNVGAQAGWTEEEDKILVDSVNELGKKWKEISKKIGNKTSSSCRQRYDKLKRALDKQSSTEGPTRRGPTPSVSLPASPKTTFVEVSYGFVHSSFPSSSTLPEVPLDPGKQRELEIVQEWSLQDQSQSAMDVSSPDVGLQTASSGAKKSRPRPKPRLKTIPRTENKNAQASTSSDAREGDNVPSASAITSDQNPPGLSGAGRKRKTRNMTEGDADTSLPPKKTRTTRSKARVSAASHIDKS